MILINADEHECLACTHHATGKCDTWCDASESFELREDVKNAKTVEAIPVVRCKECEHWHRKTGWCNIHSHFIDHDGEACHPWESREWKMFFENDYCSYGERKKVQDGKINKKN